MRYVLNVDQGDIDDYVALAKHLKGASGLVNGHPISFSVKETDHGSGAGWGTLTIELVWTAAGLFFAIPAARKKIKDAAEGWEDILSDLEALLVRLGIVERIVSYSMDHTYLEMLRKLSTSTSITGVRHLSAIEIPGDADPAQEEGLEASSLLYYVFVLSDGVGYMHVIVYDNRLNELNHLRLPLSDLQAVEDEMKLEEHEQNVPPVGSSADEWAASYTAQERQWNAASRELMRRRRSGDAAAE